MHIEKRPMPHRIVYHPYSMTAIFKLLCDLAELILHKKTNFSLRVSYELGNLELMRSISKWILKFLYHSLIALSSLCAC